MHRGSWKDLRQFLKLFQTNRDVFVKTMRFPTVLVVILLCDVALQSNRF